MLKTIRIGLIVSEEEKTWVVQLSRIEGGLSQASLIRRLIHKAALQHGLVGRGKNLASSEEEDYEKLAMKLASSC